MQAGGSPGLISGQGTRSHMPQLKKKKKKKNSTHYNQDPAQPKNKQPTTRYQGDSQAIKVKPHYAQVYHNHLISKSQTQIHILISYFNYLLHLNLNIAKQCQLPCPPSKEHSPLLKLPLSVQETLSPQRLETPSSLSPLSIPQLVLSILL